MARIARLNDGYWINFDDHWLYQNDEKQIELNKRALDVLEYLAKYPNCYKTWKNIAIAIDPDPAQTADYAPDTIRGYIKKLHIHPVMEKLVQNKRGSGYIYTGNKIEITDIPTGGKSDEAAEYSLISFLQSEEQFETDLLNAIMYCSCKWGACTFDEIPQNTNTCEGILALLSSRHRNKYSDTIEDAVDYLNNELIEKGLKSKSLDEETVVPTSMYVLLNRKLFNDCDERTKNIIEKIWKFRSSNGWGIYVKKMEKYANIGCTYWAIMGLVGSNSISEGDFQKYIRSLFKYENTYSFGRTINDANPRMPSLYATSMMYIIYSLLSENSKKSIGKRYDAEKAIKYIVDNFDKPFYLTEQEGINGVEVDGKISVHTVGWNHMTINYSLTALAIALKNGVFKMDAINEILKRIEKVVIDNSEVNEGKMFWSAPTMTIEKGNRGKMIFPSMHLIMGLSEIREAVMEIVKTM